MKKIQHQFETVMIQSASSQATFVPQRGGTISSLILGQHELLYLHDFFWDKEIDDLGGGWPFLFPVCARLSRDGKYGIYQYQGNYYQLPIHGFSWYLPWEIVSHQKDAITLKLKFNDKTLKQYPFQFELELKYKITANSLMCEQTYRNHGDKAMPFYAGFHPYFLIPKNIKKNQVKIEFKSTERLLYNEALTDIYKTTKPFTGKHFIDETELNESLSLMDTNFVPRLIFPDYTLTLDANANKQNIFPYLQLYHMPKKSFFCMETWMSFPNALNSVSGVRWVKPSEHLTAELLLNIASH